MSFIDYKTKLKDKVLSYGSNRFIFYFTPVWFQWLGWAIILGSLSYLEKNADVFALTFIIGFSYVLLFLYMIKYFEQWEWEKYLPIKSPTFSLIFSSLLSSVIGFSLWMLLASIINALEQTGAK
jgi:hypothetical protein